MVKKVNDSEFKNSFLDSNTYEDLQIDDASHVKSYSKVLNAGNLDVTAFLENTKKYLIKNKSYLEEEFDYTRLAISPQEIIYKDIPAGNIIFCDGHLITKNPYFNWVPMKPAKGETITIRSKHLKLQQDVFNKGFFILPLGDSLFKVGATYEWEQLNDIPTEKGKLNLGEKLNSVLTTPYEIISHEAGVRPSVIDRRPIVGQHPELKNVCVFNGFGTKAVMLAPFFAKQLVEFIQSGAAIDIEVNPSRFKMA